MQIKHFCDVYYEKPAVNIEEIRNVRIHENYIVEVDHDKVQEIDPETYLKRAMQKGVIHNYLLPETKE